MSKQAGFLVGTLTVLVAAVVLHAQGSPPTAVPGAVPPTDPRVLVEMPEGARRLMRQDMLSHMAAVNEILGLLARNEVKRAGEVAESRMGVSTMGRHRGTGMGPGRFMPPEMHAIGIGLHQAATELARVAATGDAEATRNALPKVTSYCVACHMAYRTY